MARSDVRLYATALIITALIFSSLYTINLILSQKREDSVTQRMDEIIEDFEEIESTYYLINYINATPQTCGALIDSLNDMEGRLWKLDVSIR